MTTVFETMIAKAQDAVTAADQAREVAQLAEGAYREAHEGQQDNKLRRAVSEAFLVVVEKKDALERLEEIKATQPAMVEWYNTHG